MCASHKFRFVAVEMILNLSEFKLTSSKVSLEKFSYQFGNG